VVLEIIGDYPHTVKAVCRALSNKLANKRCSEIHGQPLSESQLMIVEYSLSYLAKSGTISVGPHWVNTSTDRVLDEALTEGEEK
jgi:hypothetical protein